MTGQASLRGDYSIAPPGAATGSGLSDAGRRLHRLAFGALVILAVSFGLGDIDQLTPLNTVLLNAVHGLLPLVLALAFGGVILNHGRRRALAIPRRVWLPLFAWLSVLALSAAIAPTDSSAALTALERPVTGVLLAWSTCLLCGTRGRWLLLARALAVGGLVIAAIGLAEAIGLPGSQAWLRSLHDGPVPIGDVQRLTSMLSHPNLAALLLELSLPLLLAWAWTTRQPWGAILAFSAFSTLVALVQTFSRAGIVAALAGLTVMLGFSLGLDRGARGRWQTLAFVVLAAPAAVLFAALTDPGLDRRLAAELGPSIPGPPTSSHVVPGRADYWRAASSMALQYPWLGVGPDNYRWQFATYSGQLANNVGTHAHNQYLEALADTGLLGLLSLAWLLASLVRIALERVRSTTASGRQEDWPWRAAMLASLIAWLLHAILDDFERFWPASIFFWLIVGLLLGVPEADREHALRRNEHPKGRTT